VIEKQKLIALMDCEYEIRILQAEFSLALMQQLLGL
jgi:hypothetical protein